MELSEIYKTLNGDYDSALRRLRKEERVKKYLLMFLNYEYDSTITKLIEQKDYETAFREAHDLKGICANLSLDVLGCIASDITESLRPGKMTSKDFDIKETLEDLKKEYQKTVDAIKKLQEIR